MSSPETFWRRLTAAVEREQRRYGRPRLTDTQRKLLLANQLLRTLSPTVLVETGHLRHRWVRRRSRTVHVRQSGLARPWP